MQRRDFLIAAAGAGVGLGSAPAFAFQRVGKRKILVFSGGQPVPVLDPHVRYDYSTRMMQLAVYDALLKYEGNPAKVVPWLAETWDVSPDGLTYTFHLVGNAKFHNGDPVDAEAVRFSFLRGLRLNKGVAWMLKGHVDPAGIKAPDARTVVFTLPRPFPGFVSFVPWWFVVNPKQVMANTKNNDDGQDWLIAHEAGSGPFAIRRWDAQSVMDLRAVPDYWRGWPMGDANRLDGVILQVIREPAPRKQALQRGSVDMITDMTPEDYDELAKQKGIVVPSFPGMTTFDVLFNTAHGPTANLDLRKAIAYAVNYKAFLQIENGHARLMDSPFPSALTDHVAIADMPRQDVARAKAYLARTPYAKGGLALDYVYVAGLEVERQVGLSILSDLQALGIKVNVQGLPWPTLVSRGINPETAPAMVAVYVTPVTTDPDVVASQFASGAGGQYWGMHHLNDPELDKMIAQARIEIDPAKRAALYAAIQQKIVADQPAVFGMLEDRRWAMRDYVKGFSFSPVRLTGEVDFYPMWIDAG